MTHEAPRNSMWLYMAWALGAAQTWFPAHRAVAYGISVALLLILVFTFTGGNHEERSRD